MQGVRRVINLRARSYTLSLQGVRRGLNLRARSSGKQSAKCGGSQICEHGSRVVANSAVGARSASTVVALYMQRVRWVSNLRARSSSALSAVLDLRARSSSVQGVRWGLDLRARSSALSVQGVRASICEHGRFVAPRINESAVVRHCFRWSTVGRAGWCESRGIARRRAVAFARSKVGLRCYVPTPGRSLVVHGLVPEVRVVVPVAGGVVMMLLVLVLVPPPPPPPPERVTGPPVVVNACPNF